MTSVNHMANMVVLAAQEVRVARAFSFPAFAKVTGIVAGITGGEQ